MTKRSFPNAIGVSGNTRSKKPRLNSGLRDVVKNKPWISATKTYNFMNDDPIVDWLEKAWKRRERSDSSTGIPNETFLEFIRKRGIEFEEKIVNYINQNIHPVVKVADHYSAAGVKRAEELLFQGIPILHSVPLAHKRTKTYGIADLIVRSDFLEKIFTGFTPVTDLSRSCRFSPNYHYIVIDIKYSTLHLNSSGQYLINQGSYPAYKAQVWIYNRALGGIQHYTPECGYILGRRWKFKKSSIQYRNFSCFDRPGIIEFNSYDKKIIKKAHKALKWCRDVKNEGVRWSIFPPSRSELYPNMCRDNPKWNSTKKKIASELGEITQVWMCGVKNRKAAFLKNIKSWKDPLADSSSLGVTGVRGEIVDKMLVINRQQTDKVLPKIIRGNLLDWRDSSNEVYVDFETFSDIFSSLDVIPNQPAMNIIYLIGAGYFENSSWKYKYFICHKPTKTEEFRIMREFTEFLQDRSNPSIYYWHAEKNFWKRSCNSQFERYDISSEEKDEVISWNLNNSLKDLRKLFIEEKIVIKDCFGYGLKNIGKCLKKFNLIDTPLESECSNGTTAMVQAWRCYQKFNRPWKCGAMKDVTQYNEYDCRLVGDILSYLRRNH